MPKDAAPAATRVAGPDDSPAPAALAQATAAIGLSDPNPRVGCVITGRDPADPWAMGHTQQAGGPHAEDPGESTSICIYEGPGAHKPGTSGG